MKDHIIIKLVKAAKERHGGHGIHIYPIHGKTWHESHVFEEGYHFLYYHLSKVEKTCHCIAISALTGKVLQEDS